MPRVRGLGELEWLDDCLLSLKLDVPVFYTDHFELWATTEANHEEMVQKRAANLLQKVFDPTKTHAASLLMRAREGRGEGIPERDILQAIDYIVSDGTMFSGWEVKEEGEFFWDVGSEKVYGHDNFCDGWPEERLFSYVDPRIIALFRRFNPSIEFLRQYGNDTILFYQIPKYDIERPTRYIEATAKTMTKWWRKINRGGTPAST